LATELPTGSQAPEVRTAIGTHNLLVVKFYGIIHAPVVNNFSQKKVLVAIRVTLGIHLFGN
jgi:hypothetical protein